MSNPHGPEGGAPFSGDSQQPANPNSGFGQYSPYGPPANQPGAFPYQQPTPPPQPANPYGQPAPYGVDTNNFPTEQTPQPGYPYGQPAGPSQPLYPYGQPTNPSQPLYPYGQYGSPSQTLPGYPGQFGPPSQAFPGAGPAAPSRGSSRGLIIGSVIVLVVLLLVGSSTAFALTQVQPAAASAAARFCTALKAQDYSTAWSDLSAGMQSQYTQSQFALDMGVLDKAAGNVTSCQQSTAANAYRYSFGSSTASDLILISRGSNALQGLVHLSNAGNVLSANWKVDALDTSLLGVNLKAVEAGTAFCTAVQSKDYATAFAAFATPPTSLQTATQFADSAGLWEQIDGAVSSCAISGLGSSNDDTSANLTLSLTRAKSGAHTSDISLSANGGQWKITHLDASVFGTDLGPAQTTKRFCTDLSKGQYADLVEIFTGTASASEIADVFSGKLNDVKWSGCTLTLSSSNYTVSSSEATVTVTMNLVQVSTGRTASPGLQVKLIKSGGSWKINDLVFK